MKKKVLVVASILTIALITLLIFIFAPKYTYEVEFEEDIVVEDGRAREDQRELTYVIVIPKDGLYVTRAKWEISPEGMLMGCSIRDEEGNDFNTFSAYWIDMSSGAMEMKAGKYTMTLTPLTSVEGWQEYFAGFDTSDWDEGVEEGELPDTQFATDGVFHFDFDFKLEKQRNMLLLICVLGVVIGLLLAVLLIVFSHTDHGLTGNYDERQELQRGKGGKYGLFSMLFFNCLIFILEQGGIHLPMSGGYAAMLSAMLGVGVYATYCIWKDAYLALNQKAGRFIAIFLGIGIMNLIMGIDAFVEGVAIQNNQLTLRSMNLVCALFILFICGVLVLKKLCKDREEE